MLDSKSLSVEHTSKQWAQGHNLGVQNVQGIDEIKHQFPSEVDKICLNRAFRECSRKHITSKQQNPERNISSLSPNPLQS